MNTLVTAKAERLLKGEMCICLDDLSSHILLKAPEKLPIFRALFDLLTTLEAPHKDTKLGSSEYFENDDYFNNSILNFAESQGVIDDTEEYYIIDNIRHAFIMFKSSGLYSLYKHREAENWYPKIIIRKHIGVDQLKDEVLIFRGTSKAEYESGKYSQSWALKEEVAHDFAFKHYQNHDLYINTERVVLKAKIDRRHVYYYNTNENEQEVIINEEKIESGSVKVISQRILN